MAIANVKQNSAWTLARPTSTSAYVTLHNTCRVLFYSTIYTTTGNRRLEDQSQARRDTVHKAGGFDWAPIWLKSRSLMTCDMSPWIDSIVFLQLLAHATSKTVTMQKMSFWINYSTVSRNHTQRGAANHYRCRRRTCWNSLPDTLKNINVSLQTFKRHVKTFLFSSYSTFSTFEVYSKTHYINSLSLLLL